MARAIRFDEYGDVDVLRVEDVPRPAPGPGQVLVEVRAAGINPGEGYIRQGLLHDRWPATFPSGQGSDFAGVVAELGEGVEEIEAGDEVIGFASEANHPWLRELDVIPVAYGDGVLERIKEAAPDGVHAFVDTFGSGYVELALHLGIHPSRIDTIIDWAAAEKYNVKTDGNTAGASAEVLRDLAALVDKGLLEVPVARVYPLDEVHEAYRELEKRHTRGKIVLRP